MSMTQYRGLTIAFKLRSKSSFRVTRCSRRSRVSSRKTCAFSRSRSLFKVDFCEIFCLLRVGVEMVFSWLAPPLHHSLSLSFSLSSLRQNQAQLLYRACENTFSKHFHVCSQKQLDAIDAEITRLSQLLQEEKVSFEIFISFFFAIQIFLFPFSIFLFQMSRKNPSSQSPGISEREKKSKNSVKFGFVEVREFKREGGGGGGVPHDGGPSLGLSWNLSKTEHTGLSLSLTHFQSSCDDACSHPRCQTSTRERTTKKCAKKVRSQAASGSRPVTAGRCSLAQVCSGV